MKNKIAGRKSLTFLFLLVVTFLIFCFVPITVAITEIPSNKSTKNIASSTVKSVPKILQNISWCESKNRQFNTDGSVYRGSINPKDVGKYQINEFYHLEASKKLGMDIYTEEGNEAYALWLYQHDGTTPWNWSKGCWGGKIIKN